MILPKAFFVFLLIPSILDVVSSFTVAPNLRNNNGIKRSLPVVLYATNKKGDISSGSQKRRRRKNPPGTPAKDPVKISQEKLEGLSDDGRMITTQADVDNDDDDIDATEQQRKNDSEVAQFEFQRDKESTMSLKGDTVIKKSDNKEIPLPDISQFTSKVRMEETASEEEKEAIRRDFSMISEVAKFEFKRAIQNDGITKGVTDVDISSSSEDIDKSLAIPLPDITEVRKKKQMEEELKRIEEEKQEKKVKIKRSDKEAFRKLLEQQPFSDADDSLFEEEAYGTVSILLGEKAMPFLGIPFGPLQVGHFIGALGILLMAYVEYPGFPLTNLPTPLRECFQGGLLTVYTTNCVLAVASAFKAMERGQPVTIWVMKTIAVGGLAYDQLTQLPTTAEIEKAKAVKGKRALKNKKGVKN